MTRRKSTPSRKRPRPVPPRATSKTHEGRLALGRAHEDGQAIYSGSPTKYDLPESYSLTLLCLRQRIHHERFRAVLDANAPMTDLFLNIGHIILARQQAASAAAWPEPAIVQGALHKCVRSAAA